MENFVNALLDKISPAINFVNNAVSALGLVAKSDIAKRIAEVEQASILDKFSDIIYELVRQYASDNMGKKWLVCLPASPIMQRIWANESVPTNPLQPQIEYIVDEKGYFQYIPPELDGVITTASGTSVFTADEINQIDRKFMTEPDGRFYPFVGMDWKPQGNCSFNSNGINRAMFQDLPVSDFRPNRIASANPSYVLISCSTKQLVKRPDLCLVEISTPVMFDPADPIDLVHSFWNDSKWSEYVGSKAGIIKYLWYYYKRHVEFRKALVNTLPAGMALNQYASQIICMWADTLQSTISDPFRHEMATEVVMDLKGVCIPLTSTWVSYGPWYYTYAEAQGMRKIDVDPSLVPWNFDRPPLASGWDYNLNLAGNEKLARSLSIVDYLDNASITVAGFPEFGLGQQFGYNSNLTGLSVDFSIGGVKTTYNLATYLAKPGTYRKGDYDNVSRARVDTREKLPDTINENLVYSDDGAGILGPNQFRY
eukprot:gnl/Spiro4/23622_TR11677_c0_g1_i1.p1 gnl/Spiro4/23622_TR11677_c0_g1~~gnl/Spiro4/23622_TR11677_c0_g1_i1.p1  ORF type:complete len:540 (+),score=-124.98 gnl/Spiro4/23622_TR11677_c0_g1_i1:176-1621(+)